jgi:hypothetical protein
MNSKELQAKSYVLPINSNINKLTELISCNNRELIDTFIFDLYDLYTDSEIRKFHCNNRIYINNGKLMILPISNKKKAKKPIIRSLIRRILNVCDYYDYILTRYIRNKVDLETVKDVLLINNSLPSMMPSLMSI